VTYGGATTSVNAIAGPHPLLRQTFRAQPMPHEFMEPTIPCVVWNSVHLPKDMQLYRCQTKAERRGADPKKQKPF
jgi:hypothetical protein